MGTSMSLPSDVFLIMKIRKIKSLIYDLRIVLQLFNCSDDVNIRIKCNQLLQMISKLPTVDSLQYRKLDDNYIEEELESIRKIISKFDIPDMKRIDRIAETQHKCKYQKEIIFELDEYIILSPTCFNCVDYYNDSHNWEAEQLTREIHNAGQELESDEEEEDSTVIIIS